MASGHAVPHQQAEHMAAPTNAAYVKKTLANREPSTHGASLPSASGHVTTAFSPGPDLERTLPAAAE